MATQTIVTKESLQTMLDNTNPNYVMAVVGRALVQLHKRQTESEKVTNSTQEHNGVGFAGCDARSGSMTAKFYLKHNKLEQWMIEKWLKRGSNGFSRLTKYHAQLNQVATSK
ncbi:MAG: hypothetical protein CTY12_00695 [Methylotenera sp.]|nr:MAG: hypothetical protein CTY12_00695 [Methylotenera sp.]